ncbi:MAG: FkbM family methyltransferase [Saprospiraceae bacterium]|nr:FkbM family methyltransferase [Saprospiraceae bacterium]
MLSTIKNFSFIFKHPINRGKPFKTLKRILAWQIGSRLLPYPIVFNYANDARIVVKRSKTGSTGAYYMGLHDFPEMSFLMHYLRPGEVFMDIGSNVGSYAILAGSVAKAQCYAIEPIPSTHAELMENIKLNNLEEMVHAVNIGIGRSEGVLRFTSDSDTVNHIVPQDDTSTKNTVSVNVESLDYFVEKENIAPAFMKIDVEGFESDVVAGGLKTLANPNLRGVVMELIGFGSKYGFDESKIHEQMLALGFGTYDYLPFERKLVKTHHIGAHNTLYLRDLPFVQERLDSAQKVNVLGKVY